MGVFGYGYRCRSITREEEVEESRFTGWRDWTVAMAMGRMGARERGWRWGIVERWRERRVRSEPWLDISHLKMYNQK